MGCRRLRTDDGVWRSWMAEPLRQGEALFSIAEAAAACGVGNRTRNSLDKHATHALAVFLS